MSTDWRLSEIYKHRQWLWRNWEKTFVYVSFKGWRSIASPTITVYRYSISGSYFWKLNKSQSSFVDHWKICRSRVLRNLASRGCSWRAIDSSVRVIECDVWDSYMFLLCWLNYCALRIFVAFWRPGDLYSGVELLQFTSAARRVSVPNFLYPR